jgi:hypothetical protein
METVPLEARLGGFISDRRMVCFGTLVWVSVTVRLSSKVHGIPNTNCSSKSGKLKFVVEGDLTERWGRRRPPTHLVQPVSRVGLLPFPPDAVQSSVVKVE